MAKNGPRGSGCKGTVRGRVQHYNPSNNRWVKFNRNTGRIMDVKSDSKPFKGVAKD